MFGGNSNWRGPVWFPLNYLVISALERYDRFFGDDYTVEYPTGSGQQLPLERDRRRPARAADLDLPGRAGRAAALLRRGRAAAARPALEGQPDVQRVLPRRQRRRARARPPDGLDRPGRRHHPAPARRGAARSATCCATPGRRTAAVTRPDPDAAALRPGSRFPLGATARRRRHELRGRLGVADGVLLCLFDEQRRRRPGSPLPDCDAGVWHGFVPGVGAGPGLRLPGDRARTSRPAACAATRPSCCSTPTPGRSTGEVRFGPEVLGYDARRPRPAERARLGRPRAAQPGRRPGLRAGPTEPAPRHAGTPTRSSTRCTSRASPRRTPDVPPELRGTYAGLGHEAAIAHLRRPRRHRGRAAPGAPERARGVPRSTGA